MAYINKLSLSLSPGEKQRQRQKKSIKEKIMIKHHVEINAGSCEIQLSNLFSIEKAFILRISISYDNNCSTPCGVRLKIDQYDESSEYLIPNKSLMDPNISTNSVFYAEQQKIMIDDYFCEWVLPSDQWDQYVTCETSEYVWIKRTPRLFYLLISCDIGGLCPNTDFYELILRYQFIEDIQLEKSVWNTIRVSLDRIGLSSFKDSSITFSDYYPRTFIKMSGSIDLCITLTMHSSSIIHKK